MKSKIIISFLFLLLLNIGCKTSSTTTNTSVEKQIEQVTPKREHSVQALLWQQQSAEYKALSHQAFNLAKLYLDKARINYNKKPTAIITDIDETVLDNSPYNARMVRDDVDYTRETWNAWGKEETAKAVPGALAFFKYADSKGVKIFYLSNRREEQKEETIQNLIKAGFPAVDSEHVLLRTDTGDKQPRRDLILKNHYVVMLLGDNLSDFSESFDNQSTNKRNDLVEKMKNDFGTKFIVLPNPMYGDWETKGIYEGSYKWTAKQKDSIRKAKLLVD